MEDQQYKIELANHANFYRAQKDVVIRLEQAILDRYFNTPNTDFDVIVIQEVRKELDRLSQAESMNRPNEPGHYRANND